MNSLTLQKPEPKTSSLDVVVTHPKTGRLVLHWFMVDDKLTGQWISA